MKYRYVPAVKSKEYFKSLLSDLYNTASTVIDSPLNTSMVKFSNAIQNYTQQIHDEVNQKIGIDSKLAIPSDMSDMFRTLIFETSNSTGDSIPLDMRGDGIQARHIPIILKYIADRDKETRNQGATSVTTIWGYEEPENGVELSKTFDMADDFHDYSGDIQMLITTHSPAFYGSSINKDKLHSKVLYVSQSINGTKASEQITNQYLDQTMGLMTLVTPYVEEQKDLLKEMRKKYSEEMLADIPTIFVEGKTDKAYIETSIHLFSNKLTNLLNNDQLRIYTKDGEGGCKNIQRHVLSWILKGNKSKAIALFDKDSAGMSAKDELTKYEIYTKFSKNVKVKSIQPSEEIKKLYDHKINLPYEIEHLLSVDCWMQIIKNNMAKERGTDELYNILGKDFDLNRPPKDILKEKINNDNLLNTIVLYNPVDDQKSKILSFILNQEESVQREYLSGLNPTIKLLESTFCCQDNS